MKSKLLLFVSCLAMGALVACDGLGGLVPDGGGSNGDSSGQQGGGINLPDTMEQAFNKFYQLGKEQGFEVTFNSMGEDDSGQAVRESDTVGFKNDVFWIQGESAYKEVTSGLEYYQYDTQKQSYEYQGSVQYPLQTIAQQFTSQFYAGYQYVSSAQGSLTDVKDVTVAGRAAKEYTFAYTALDAVGTLKLVFDNQTGITLKIYGTAATGAETSSAEFEVTSFKIGDQVTVPILNKDGGGQGGEGGEGEQGDPTAFNNKLLVYVSNENASMYANSQLALFSDKKFELVFMQSGYQVVYFGEFTVASNNASATLVAKKVYKFQTKQYNDISQTWTLTYADRGYSLQITSTGKVNYMASGQEPSHIDIPGEGGDTTKMVNHLFTYVSQQSASGFVNSTLALFSDYTFEIVTPEKVYLGTYTVNTAQTEARLSVVKAYNKQSKSYEEAVGNWILTAQANNQFYLAMPGATVIYVASASAPTHADIPEDQGQGGDNPEDDKYKVTKEQWESLILGAELVGFNSNVTARVTTSDNQVGYTLYEFDKGNIRVFSIDADGTPYEYYAEFTESEGNYKYVKDEETGVWNKEVNTFGIGSYMNSLGMLAIDYDSLSFNSTTKNYEVASWSYNGGQTYTNINFSFENGNLQKMTYQGQYASREVNFSKYGTTEVELPEIGGGQQEQSKWPAEEIAAKLTQISVNVAIPAPDISDDDIASVTAVVPEDNSELRITLTLASSRLLITVLSQYVSGIQGFATNYASDPNNGLYYLVNEAQDTLIQLIFDPKFESPVITIVVSKFNGFPYPSDKVAAFITANELTTAFPSLAMNNASYGFFSEGEDMVFISISPLNNNTPEDIIDNVITTLMDARFKAVYVPADSEEGGLSPRYIDPAVEYFVQIMTLEDGTVFVCIAVGGEEMAAAVDLEYPQEKINALIPEEVTDTLPTLAVTGAAYMVAEDGNGFQLQVSLQPNGITIERALSDLQTRISRAEYIYNEEDEGYHSPNNQIGIYLSNRFDKMIEIQVRFIEEEEPPVEPEDILYTFVCENDWTPGSIFDDDAMFYAYVWNDYGEEDWIPLEFVEGQTFTAEISSKWTYCIIVRLDPEKEVGWDAKWNQSDDLKLSGEESTINFSFTK